MTSPVRLLRLFFALCLSQLLVQCSSTKGGGGGGGSQWTYHYKPGKTSLLVGDQAVAQANIPTKVQRAISAGNRLRKMPYKFGGGHRKFEDSGYDCSGTVSYVLHAMDMINEPTTSEALRKFGRSGEGEWVTIYAKDGHAFLVIAGLRLDSTGSGRREHGPRWTKSSRSLKGFRARHPAGL